MALGPILETPGSCFAMFLLLVESPITDRLVCCLVDGRLGQTNPNSLWGGCNQCLLQLHPAGLLGFFLPSGWRSPRFALTCHWASWVLYLCCCCFPFGAAVCAQHIRRLPKGCRACRTLIISSSLCLPLRLAFRIRLQIPSSKAFPHPYIPSPGPARTAQPSQKLREIPF